jgi:hypothetical protein
MPVSEFHRAQTVRLISEVATQLTQTDMPAQVVAQAESFDGEVPIPNFELLKEESEAQGLHFILHQEEKGDSIWYVGLISRTKELDAAQLESCLQAARSQEKSPGA